MRQSSPDKSAACVKTPTLWEPEVKQCWAACVEAMLCILLHNVFFFFYQHSHWWLPSVTGLWAVLFLQSLVSLIMNPTTTRETQYLLTRFDCCSHRVLVGYMLYMSDTSGSLGFFLVIVRSILTRDYRKSRIQNWKIGNVANVLLDATWFQFELAVERIRI